MIQVFKIITQKDKTDNNIINLMASLLLPLCSLIFALIFCTVGLIASYSDGNNMHHSMTECLTVHPLWSQVNSSCIKILSMNVSVSIFSVLKTLWCDGSNEHVEGRGHHNWDHCRPTNYFTKVKEKIVKMCIVFQQYFSLYHECLRFGRIGLQVTFCWEIPPLFLEVSNP